MTPSSEAAAALEPFQPAPHLRYTLDAAAHLARLPRRVVLVYCREGLVQPEFLPPYGVMVFTEAAIRELRWIEHLRTAHGAGLASLRMLAALIVEVERLRGEVRFLRGH